MVLTLFERKTFFAKLGVLCVKTRLPHEHAATKRAEGIYSKDVPILE